MDGDLKYLVLNFKMRNSAASNIEIVHSQYLLPLYLIQCELLLSEPVCYEENLLFYGIVLFNGKLRLSRTNDIKITISL